MVEVADILNRYGAAYLQQYAISPEQLKVMNLIKICRTSALGGHLEKCTHCGYQRPAYNSCRNRHCPKCQSMAKEKWLNARREELLPCGYFHLVFTLPHILNPMILSNKKILLGALFTTVNETLQTFAKDPRWRIKGQLGVIAVLHTWSQTLMDHFHLHCLVPAGALSLDKSKWNKAREKYLFRNKSLAKAFRHRYLSQLTRLYEERALQFVGKTALLSQGNAFGKLMRSAKKKTWIVYAKWPFAGPNQVLEYLGRYTHRVAISNHRIVSMKDDCVTFNYRDRSDENKLKVMTITAVEFIRRFLLHVLPNGFVKIRYFGFLAHCNKKRYIPLIRNLIDSSAQPMEKLKETIAEMMLRLTGVDITCCPQCGKGKMMRVASIGKMIISVG